MKPSMKKLLSQVNKARLALGMNPLDALPKGKPSSWAACPIARALKIEADISFLHFASNEKAKKVARAWHVASDAHDNTITTPKNIANFILAFDRGEYPELRKSRTKNIIC